jgi:predicted GNAT family N-acyltransferase
MKYLNQSLIRKALKALKKTYSEDFDVIIAAQQEILSIFGEMTNEEISAYEIQAEEVHKKMNK